MSKVSEADVRAEVRAWLAANWNPDKPSIHTIVLLAEGQAGKRRLIYLVRDRCLEELRVELMDAQDPQTQ